MWADRKDKHKDKHNQQGALLSILQIQISTIDIKSTSDKHPTHSKFHPTNSKRQHSNCPQQIQSSNIQIHLQQIQAPKFKSPPTNLKLQDGASILLEKI